MTCFVTEGCLPGVRTHHHLVGKTLLLPASWAPLSRSSSLPENRVLPLSVAACLLFSAAPAPGKSSLRSKPSPSGLALTSYSYSLGRCLAFGAGRGVPFQRSAKSSAMVVGRPPQFCGRNFCLSPGLGQLIRSLSASTSQMCPITMTAAASARPLPAPPG